MGTMYSFSFDDTNIDRDLDFFQMEAVTVPLKIHAVYLSQHTQVGDIKAEAVHISLNGEITNSVSDFGGAAQLNSEIIRANLCNLNLINTTQIITNLVNYHNEAWVIELPFVWLSTPQTQIIQKPGDAFTVGIMGHPINPFQCSGTVYFEEI